MTNLIKTCFTVFTVLSVFLLAACGSYGREGRDAQIEDIEFQRNAPTALFNPDTADQVLPFPYNLAFLDSTDGTINIALQPGDDRSTENPVVALNQMNGFATSAAITTEFSKQVDPATLIIGETIRIFEIEPTTGTAVPGQLNSSLEIRDPALIDVSQDDGLLRLAPTRPLKPDTGYLVALTTGIADFEERSLQASEIYDLLKEDNVLVNETLEQLRQDTGKNIRALRALGISSDELALSWVFKTQSVRDPIQAVKNISSQSTLFLISGALTTADVDAGIANFSFDGHADIWVGALQVPYYQTALIDDDTSTEANTTSDDVLNSFWRNASGKPVGWENTSGAPDYTPVATSTVRIPVLLTVPNETAGVFGEQMPPEGWPTTIFAHGFGRSRSDALALADTMARAGRALIAIDMPLHGVPDDDSGLHASENPYNPQERTFELDLIDNTTSGTDDIVYEPDGIVDPSGTHFINAANLANLRDNLRQSIADLFTLRASIGFEAAQGVKLDPNNVSFVGHSYGAIAGIPVLAYDSASYSAASLVNVGGGFGQLLADSGEFGPPLNNVLAEQGRVPGTAEYEEFLTLMQTLVESTDPVNYADSVASALPIHVIEVFGDRVLSNDVDGAPLSGSSVLIDLLNLPMIDSTTSTSGAVRFIEGEHASFLDPSSNPDATDEMQNQVAGFALSRGSDLPVLNRSVIETLP
ncbi:MAG: Ig-like domain-containing protein [Granulosicoccus sp.]